MVDDIRNKTTINHSDVIALNFIRSSAPYFFRKHFRQGLRSLIIEIHNPDDITKEKKGIISEGVRRFPKALPRNMFRLFRTRLKNLAEGWIEIERFKVVSHYLAPDFLAHSYEFIVDYNGPQGFEPMLCGFQEFIDGEVVDPWTILSTETLLPTLYDTMRKRGLVGSLPADEWIVGARRKGRQFVNKVKSMVTQSGYIPDLAGVGNLRLKTGGEICLVDLNNISHINADASITLDEKGYQVFDKSIESLSLIEEKIVGTPIDMGEKLYKRFLNTHRKRLVEERMDVFNKMMQREGNELVSTQ